MTAAKIIDQLSGSDHMSACVDEAGQSLSDYVLMPPERLLTRAHACVILDARRPPNAAANMHKP